MPERLVVGGGALNSSLENRLPDYVDLRTQCGLLKTTIALTSTGSVQIGDEPSDIRRSRSAAPWIAQIGNPDQLCPITWLREFLVEGPMKCQKH